MYPLYNKPDFKYKENISIIEILCVNYLINRSLGNDLLLNILRGNYRKKKKHFFQKTKLPIFFRIL